MKIIDLNVKIEYDPVKDEILNYSTILNGVAEKKTTTTKSKTSKKSKETDAILTREENKLVLSSKLVEELGASPDDRIVINYKQENGLTFPLIGLDISFGMKENGNKLTKSNTVACRGNANSVLSEFGTRFTIEPYEDKIFKLIGDNIASKPATLEEAIKKVDMGIEVTLDKTYEIEDLDFKL